ncbi:hydrolase [Streptomyces heilongjiangensis]|uniref:Hydrolase n=1 Tax=Streptomyces heilongjiangensis TaxID=945052 RepID=A0ABW1BBY6_9ACTN|nr:hydrolase [Streptomyces heilongjiangensis]MDC2948767.1 hydrolase [Streptomyces heilongjiangensis]
MTLPDERTVSPLVTAAAAAAPLAARYAREADTERRLSRPVVEALIEAGFTSHFAPREAGSVAGGFADLLAAVAVLGEGCTSAAWCASVTASAGRLTAYLPPAGREAVWEKGPQTVVSAGLIPAGSAERVPGGWLVSGTWPYVSAVDFSDWTLVAARVPGGEDVAPAVRVLAVPSADLAVEDTWRTAGLRGTGSNSAVLDRVLVPEERSVPLEVLLDGTARDSPACCHRVPLKAGNGLTLAAPLLGAARGALTRWRELVDGRLGAAGGGITAAPEAGPFEQQLARAEGEIDAAGLLLERVARSVDAGARSALGSARNGRDCALAADMLAATVDRLLRTAGTRAQAEEEGLLRRWRDVSGGAGHSGLQFATAAGAYARLLGGAPSAA